MKKQIFGTILALTLGLGCFVNYASGETLKPRKEEITPYAKVTPYAETKEGEPRTLEGKILHIDNDSFLIGIGHYAAEFKFKFIRMYSGGFVYKLIVPGPSNYKPSDEIILEYKPMPGVSHKELLELGGFEAGSYWLLQDTYIDNIDGVVIRHAPDSKK